MKYISPLIPVSESIGVGSSILINGSGKVKKLYMGRVTGVVELKAGVKLLFLANDFYRVVDRGGKLSLVRVDYMSSRSLKSVLNIKQDGKISIVTNSNKTPYHWLTLKHTSPFAALREVEELIKFGGYLLESVQEPEREAKWNLLGNYLAKKVLTKVLTGEDTIDIFSYTVSKDLANEIDEEDVNKSSEASWGADLQVFDRSTNIKEYLEYFDTYQPLEVSLLFNSSFDFVQQISDYPRVDNYQVDEANVLIEGLNIEADSEVLELIEKLRKPVSKNSNGEYLLMSLLNKNAQPPTYRNTNK